MAYNYNTCPLEYNIFLRDDIGVSLFYNIALDSQPVLKKVNCTFDLDLLKDLTTS